MKSTQILSKIESTMPFFSKTEKKLGEYILNKPESVIKMSTKELAKACDVSEPTLIRFTRKLGLSGFKDFKLSLSAEIATDQVYKGPVEVNLNDSALEIYNKLAAYTILSINSTSYTLKDSDFDAVVEEIWTAHNNKKQIFLSGMGASTILIKEFQIKMMRLNIPTVFYEDIHLRLEACTNLGENDLFICFTTLGSATQNYDLIDIAKQRGAKTILITQYGNTKLSEKADITLFTSAIENNLRLASQTSIAIQSIIVDALFLALALKEFDAISESVKESRKIFIDLGYNVSL